MHPMARGAPRVITCRYLRTSRKTGDWTVDPGARRSSSGWSKGEIDEIHCDGQGDEGLGGGRHAGGEGARRDGELQRRAREGRRDAGRRGSAPELEGGTHPVLRPKADGGGRPV